MSTESEFFEDLKEWSERKLTLIDKYLDASAKILGDLYYIDGFAGRGLYGKPGEPQTAGSPIRAAQLARKIREEKRDYSLHCINVENDRTNFDCLVEATEAYKDVTTNLFGPFVDQVDQLLKIVRDKPVLCFLDPFGINGMDMSAIARLVQRPRAKTDIIVRFDVGQARRRDGYYTSSEPSAPKHYEILCRVYGVTDKDQLRDELTRPTPAERQLAAVKFYMRRLGEQYSQRGKAFTSGYHVRSITGESKYWMIAATGHEKGYVLASDTIYSTDEDYRKEVEWYRQHSTGQLSMLSEIEPSPKQIFDEKVRELEPLLLGKCKSKPMSRLELHASILHGDWFGRVTRKHVNAALRNLIAKKLVRASNTHPSEDATTFMCS